MRLLLPLMIACVFASACKVIDPAEEIPSYISISSVSFTTSGNQGSASHNITDAWIYVDGELIGAFEIPCKVPVMAEGAHTVLILPGIKQNGMSSMRAIYPFYKGWQSTVALTRGQISTLAPAFTYFPDVTTRWNCEFSGTGTNFNPSGSATYSEITGAEAFEGESAKIQLDNVHSYFLGTSSDSFLLDPAREMYLECNYKCDQAFSIGLRNCETGDIIRWLEVAPSASWSKIYVRLNDAMTGMPTNAHYSVCFEIGYPPASSAATTVLLDNLKLIN